MHGRLLLRWLGFVNSCGRSCFPEEIVIVDPRWFLWGVAVQIFNSILVASDRSWDNSFTESVCSVFFRDAFVSARSCTSCQLVEFKNV